MTKNELYHALQTVSNDALRTATKHELQIGGKPLYGWSQEKHDAYHLEHSEEAYVVYKYCFARQMQINPD